jgi:adenosylcobinamide-GDP ribazoletransferase
VRAAAAALTFLTRVPLGRAIALDAIDVARGAFFFPIVGLAVGACVGGTALLFDHALPPLASAGLAVAVGVLVTGAMHVDALADVADALGTSRERALEIMRDPRVGAFGATAIALDLLLKVAAVSALLTRGGVLAAVVVSAALSRAGALPLASTLAYPRDEAGTGSVLSGRVSRFAAAAAVVLAAGVALVLEGRTGLAMTGTVSATVLALAFGYRGWLGGATGDCLGAAIEVSETFALLVAVALS